MDTERQNAVLALERAYSQEPALALPEGPKIKVSEAAAVLAAIYERMRQALQYDEPHLMRRAATARIIARRLRADSNSRLVTEGLVKELIRARYLQNDFYPESLFEAVAKIIEKYRLILTRRDLSPTDDHFSWLVALASAEIEEFLVPPDREDALANLMFANLRKAIILNDPGIQENEALIHLRLAVYKNLLKLDRAMLEFNLFELYYPDWKAAGELHTEEVAANLAPLRLAIEKTLAYPLDGALLAQVRRFTPPFGMLRDALQKEGASLLQDKLALAQATARAYAQRAARERQRLATTTTRALIYIFLTKAVLSFAFELPAERLIYGEVRDLPFLINFILPPFLLFLLTLSLNPPGRENEERVVAASREAVFGDGRIFGEKNKVEIKHRGRGMVLVLLAIYLLAFVLVFGAVSRTLLLLNFTPFAIALFFFYTSIVMYFGLLVRESSKELVMVGGKETVVGVAFDFIALPFLRVGSLVSAGLARLNLVALVLTLMVEAPFQTVVEVLEEWISFAREKKEEIY